MSASTHDRPHANDAEYIASLLTQQQHLFPHRTIRATIRHIAGQCGLSDTAAEDVVHASVADGQRAAGRLSRVEILDSARHLAAAANRLRSSTRMVADHQDACAA